MCGQTSEPQTFSSKNPFAKDVCLVKQVGTEYTGTWLRAGTPCRKLTNRNSYALPSSTTTRRLVSSDNILDVNDPKIPTDPTDGAEEYYLGKIEKKDSVF